MYQKLFIGLFIAILAVSGLWYISASNIQKVNIETKKVRIAYLPLVTNLPLYLSIKKKYFKEAGFDVELVKFESPNQAVDALVNRQVDLTGPGYALGILGIVEHKNPGKLKIYGISGDHDKYSGHSLLLPVNSDITSFHKLKGKKFGILGGSIQWREIAREILAQNGLDMDKDVTIVELAGSLQVQALASGQIDALLALEPVPSIALGQKIAKLWIKSPANKFITDPFWVNAGAVNAQFAAENPDTTVKILNILDKATREVNQNFDTNRKYLKDYTPLTDKLITKVPPIDFKVCSSITEKDLESVGKFLNIFTKNKVVSGRINFSQMLYCR